VPIISRVRTCKREFPELGMTAFLSESKFIAEYGGAAATFTVIERSKATVVDSSSMRAINIYPHLSVSVLVLCT
jgi:hypothetical protein